MGGYITGSHSFIDMIRSLSRGFIFTTAPPPAMMAGAQAAIELQRINPQDRMQLQRHVRTVKERLLEHGLPALPNRSHVVPLMVGDSEKCKAAADILFDEFDIHVQPINSPSVAAGQERLRISPTAAHTKSHQDHLVGVLVHIWERLGLKHVEEWRSEADGSVSEGWEDGEILEPVWTDEQLGTSESDCQGQPGKLSSSRLKAHQVPAVKHLEDTRIGW